MVFIVLTCASLYSTEKTARCSNAVHASECRVRPSLELGLEACSVNEVNFATA
jgi:hypothetical protein